MKDSKELGLKLFRKERGSVGWFGSQSKTGFVAQPHSITSMNVKNSPTELDKGSESKSEGLCSDPLLRTEIKASISIGGGLCKVLTFSFFLSHCFYSYQCTQTWMRHDPSFSLVECVMKSGWSRITTCPWQNRNVMRFGTTSLIEENSLIVIRNSPAAFPMVS